MAFHCNIMPCSEEVEAWVGHAELERLAMAVLREPYYVQNALYIKFPFLRLHILRSPLQINDTSSGGFLLIGCG